MYNMTENETKLDLIMRILQGSTGDSFHLHCLLSAQQGLGWNRLLKDVWLWMDNSSAKLLLFPKNEENRQKMGDRIDSKIVVRGLRFMGTL
jgi:hypothetical protein